MKNGLKGLAAAGLTIFLMQSTGHAGAPQNTASVLFADHVEEKDVTFDALFKSVRSKSKKPLKTRVTSKHKEDALSLKDPEARLDRYETNLEAISLLLGLDSSEKKAPKAQAISAIKPSLAVKSVDLEDKIVKLASVQENAPAQYTLVLGPIRDEFPNISNRQNPK